MIKSMPFLKSNLSGIELYVGSKLLVRYLLLGKCSCGFCFDGVGGGDKVVADFSLLVRKLEFCDFGLSNNDMFCWEVYCLVLLTLLMLLLIILLSCWLGVAKRFSNESLPLPIELILRR